MKKRLVFALFALFSAGFGIGITETDSRSSFVWSASWAAPSVSAAVTKDGNWSNISIPEFIHYDEKRGVPQIPAYSFSIGIPEGDIKLNWNFSDPVAIKIANPVAPVPVMLKTTIPQYLMDSSAYNRNLAATVDTLITYVGNQRILKISVNPVSYSFTSSSISFYRGVRITVGFSPKGARTASPGFESMLSSMILNYSTARDFRVVKPVAKMATAKAASQFTAARTFRLKLRNLSSHGTEGEGMYRVTYEQLASEASFNSARIDDIRLFAPSQIVLRQQYSTGVEDSLALRQVPTEIIDRDGDGYFESGDEIRFYGRADTRFRVENTTSIKYERNPFDTAAYYWLAINSQTADSRLKIDTVSVASSSQRKSVSKGYVIIHREFDNFNPSMDAYKDGEDYTIGWLWQNITTPCVDAINYNLMPDDSTGEIYCTSGLYGNMQVMFNGDSAVSLGSSVYRINNLSSTAANTVSIRFRGSGNENLDFYQLRYQRKLVLQGKQQIFFGQKGTDTLFDYKLFAGSTDSFAAYDVSDEYMPIKKKLSRNGDTLQFSSLGRSVSSGGRFVVLPSTAGWKSPEIIELVDTLYSSPFQVRNLRNSMLSKDYVIITHPKFATQAIKLAVHRKGFVNDSINNPAVVLVGDVYNHFSGGTVDPAAVRNFIMYANKYWGTHTVVLFGAGYRKYRVADGAPLVPTYLPFDGIETSRQTSLSGSFSTCTDDFFMNGNGWKVKVGRFPVATESEAEALVDKTIGFDLAAEDQKNWRNRMLLTADDDMQLSAPDEIITGSYYHHMSGTEACDSIFPRTSERVKVYLQKYPADPITKEKPLAEYDLVENINRGALIWYYVGHGASDLISSEKLFTVASSMKKLSNAGRNGLFWAASCNVGKFDDPSIEGLCVKLLTERDKGTVVSVGASRKSYAGFGYNDGLLYEFTKALFRTKKSLSVGEALMEAKIQKGGSNSSHYNLLGDPALKLYPEAGSVSIDPASLPDSLNVLNRYTATGSVSGMQTGDVYIRLKEADMKEMVSYGTFSGGQAGMNIVRPGRSVVTGASSLVNGAFSVSLLIPKDAPVGMSGVSASCFAASNGIISAKTIDTIKIGEYTGTGTIRGDGKGPAIRFYLSNNVPISGTEIPNSMPVSGSATVNRKTTLTIEIEDIDGLRLNSVGPNEALYFEVPGLSGRRYIESVKDVSGRPSSGYFSVRLDELFGSTSKNPAGEKLQFRVFAMDNFDNSTSGLLTLNFQSDSALGLNREQVYPYPNPFTKETRIVWSTILPADVTVNIYTQNGSLIRVLKSIGVTGAYDPNANSLWDGRDERGNKMARGVYFYTVHIKGSTVAGTANASKEDVLRGAMLRE